MSSMQNGRSSVIILCLWKYRTQYLKSVKDFPVTQMAKNLPAMQETQVQSLGQEDPLEKETATHSIFLPAESHEQRSLVSSSSWGCKESDTTE